MTAPDHNTRIAWTLKLTQHDKEILERVNAFALRGVRECDHDELVRILANVREAKEPVRKEKKPK